MADLQTSCIIGLDMLLVDTIFDLSYLLIACKV